MHGHWWVDVVICLGVFGAVAWAELWVRVR